MKMQRRSFLKTVGATLAGTLGLGATKSLPKPAVPKFATGGLVNMDRPFPRLSGKHDGEVVLPRHYNCRCQTEAVKRFPAYDPRCIFNFRSTQCDYKGREMFCDGTYADCQARGNRENFGAFPPTKEVRIEVKAIDPESLRRYMTTNKKEIARIVSRA